MIANKKIKNYILSAKVLKLYAYCCNISTRLNLLLSNKRRNQKKFLDLFYNWIIKSIIKNTLV